MLNKGDFKPIKDGETWEAVSKNQKANFDKLVDEVNKKAEATALEGKADKTQLSNLATKEELSKKADTSALANKVDKDGSKVLSEKNFTAAMEQKLNGVAANANNYVHPTTAGNKHIPSGGSAGQVLTYKADGEAQWSTPAASASPFKAVSAPAYATGVNISQAEFDGLINKLKESGVFK